MDASEIKVKPGAYFDDDSRSPMAAALERSSPHGASSAEMLVRMQIQASLAEKLLLALLALNAGGIVLFGDHAFGVGLIAALLAFAAAFMSQHFFVLACQHEMSSDYVRERRAVIVGNVFYLPGVLLALGSITALGLGALS
ncbi:hypothetical protein NUH86_16080 [Sphingobium sp. JS3065]|uniref:hypothetical protein n=1 Tax=Sphingobium sp. JS3065 TaxID=2970925 RepID=UPI002264B519|nr:hypothetical protein [Sphingobium sp. JS3065]UZW54973.1 hypothetical protein NUH86_16080 [Sphingobium sp. JS3065]